MRKRAQQGASPARCNLNHLSPAGRGRAAGAGEGTQSCNPTAAIPPATLSALPRHSDDRRTPRSTRHAARNPACCKVSRSRPHAHLRLRCGYARYCRHSPRPHPRAVSCRLTRRALERSRVRGRSEADPSHAARRDAVEAVERRWRGGRHGERRRVRRDRQAGAVRDPGTPTSPTGCASSSPAPGG